MSPQSLLLVLVSDLTVRTSVNSLRGISAAAVLLVAAVAVAPIAFAQQNQAAPQTPPLPKPPPPQGGSIPRQEQNQEASGPVPQERWNLFWQATSVGQYHGTFPSPYSDPKFSLQAYP